MNAYSHDYPNEPGHRGVDTSIAAADAMSKISARIQREVLLAIRECVAAGLTAEELATRPSRDRTTVQPRTTELKVLGLIEDSGQRRLGASGHKQAGWVLPEYGPKSAEVPA